MGEEERLAELDLWVPRSHLSLRFLQGRGGDFDLTATGAGCGSNLKSKSPPLSQNATRMGHPLCLVSLWIYLLTATGSRAPSAGTVRPTTAAIWRTCTISSSN